MEVGLDKGFKEVTGDEVHLSISAPGVFEGLSSNNPDGKKWLATKIVHIKGKPVCWCIPVTVKTGKVTQVTLTETICSIFNRLSTRRWGNQSRTNDKGLLTYAAADSAC